MKNTNTFYSYGAFLLLLAVTTAAAVVPTVGAVISPTLENSDARIEQAAKSSYNYRTVLKDEVNVKSQNGVVTLTGVVQDKEEKTLAADTIENLPGVNRVRNEITIKSDYPEHSDGWIAFKIRSDLLVKSNVSMSSTKVDVQDGYVTLTGTANTQAQRELTEAYVKSIDGVRGIKNQIRIEGDATFVDNNQIDDASITTQVKHAISTHKSTSSLRTKVSTTDGVVRISGDAKNDSEKSLVTKLATDVRGTKSVTNDMVVR